MDDKKIKYELFEERLKRIEKRIGIIKNDHQVDVNTKAYVFNMKINVCFRFQVPRYLIRRLESEGILYIHELIEKTEDDIHKIKGIGYKGLHHLVFALKSMGLSFKEVIGKDRITELYSELIMAVESKYPDESRHETALRCIQEREKRLKAMRIGNGG